MNSVSWAVPLLAGERYRHSDRKDGKTFDMTILRQHDVALEGQTPRGVSVRLRPMTEGDWDILFKWNNDPKVLYYSEGDDVTGYTLEDVQDLYRGVSSNAFCFVIEADGKPIGECWLQRMNLERILADSEHPLKYPDLDCRRVDLMIGEKQVWGQGIGTEVIRLLTEFGFAKEGADRIFGCDVVDYNIRSRKAFQRVGYEIISRIEHEPGGKAEYGCDLVLTKEMFLETRRP